MKTISTSNARMNIKKLIDLVRDTGEAVAIGRRDNLEALLIKFPRDYNKELNEITNVNTYSDSFEFLASEPDLYSASDLKKNYV